MAKLDNHLQGVINALRAYLDEIIQRLHPKVNRVLTSGFITNRANAQLIAELFHAHSPLLLITGPNHDLVFHNEGQNGQHRNHDDGKGNYIACDKVDYCSEQPQRDKCGKQLCEIKYKVKHNHFHFDFSLNHTLQIFSPVPLLQAQGRLEVTNRIHAQF